MNANPNLPWSEQFRIVAKQWVDADAAADILEELKSATLAQLITELGDMPVNRAETKVKSDVEWQAYIRSMVEARQKANRLKVQMEYLRMKFQEWSSHEATKRTEARL
jgi:hypothetical protein